MWEYKKSDERFKKNEELVEYLDKQGKDGWELVSYEEDKLIENKKYFNVRVLFKRQKQLPAKPEVL
jgi:hypothetical protein